MITVDKRFNSIRKIGAEQHRFTDVYSRILSWSWTRFALLFCAIFILFNTVFALLYYTVPGTIGGSNGSVWEAFAFSVQTFSTIGYGMYHPATVYAHFLVVLESMLSILTTAVLTGLTFAKFARPSARVIFSKNMLVQSFDGKRTLTFRLGNLRDNHIVQAKVNIVALVSHVSKEGISIRRQVDLKPVRDTSLFFALSWTVMHVLDESSPLYGLTSEDFIAQNIEIGVSILGFDGTLSQDIHANIMYSPEDIIFDRQFEDMMTIKDGRVLSVDYRLLSTLK